MTVLPEYLPSVLVLLLYLYLEATKALVKGMNERGQGDMYKSISTPNSTQEIVKQFNENWFFVDEKQVVRE